MDMDPSNLTRAAGICIVVIILMTLVAPLMTGKKSTLSHSAASGGAITTNPQTGASSGQNVPGAERGAVMPQSTGAQTSPSMPQGVQSVPTTPYMPQSPYTQMAPAASRPAAISSSCSCVCTCSDGHSLTLSGIESAAGMCSARDNCAPACYMKLKKAECH